MEHLDKKLDRVLEKIDKIEENIAAIDVTLVEQAGQLKHHIYRSDLNEQHIRIIEARVEPLTQLHSKFNGIMRFIGVVATGITLVVGLVKLFKELL